MVEKWYDSEYDENPYGYHTINDEVVCEGCVTNRECEDTPYEEPFEGVCVRCGYAGPPPPCPDVCPHCGKKLLDAEVR